MVLGIFVKSEKIWDILKIENLEYANANLSEANANLSERVKVLESYHGKLNCMEPNLDFKSYCFSNKAGF